MYIIRSKVIGLEDPLSNTVSIEDAFAAQASVAHSGDDELIS